MFNLLFSRIDRFMILMIIVLAVIAIIQTPPVIAGGCVACHDPGNPNVSRTMLPQHESIATLRFDSASGVSINKQTDMKSIMLSTSTASIGSGSHAADKRHLIVSRSDVAVFALAKLQRIPDN